MKARRHLSLLMSRLHHIFLGGCFSLLMSASLWGQDTVSAFDLTTLLDACNVSWDVPGPTSAQSMPVGNGDIGLNVWVEANGDLSFYIGKTDAWNQDVLDEHGLLKLGAVHISLNPSVLSPGVPFTQVLKVHEGEIQITEGSGNNAVVFLVWVDANHPVIRVEAKSGQPVALKVTLDDWRIAKPENKTTEKILPDQANRIAWYHRNNVDGEPHVANLTFGAVIKGEGFTSQDPSTLQSAKATSQLISIYPLTSTTNTPEEWLTQLEQSITQIDALSLKQTWADHQKWWDQFWRRSWIFVRGDASAKATTDGYVLQRFVTACAGRGAYPFKFNGSIFVVDNPQLPQDHKVPGVNADFRSWGGQYWFQNNRAMYWPRMAAGDFDIMQPFFKMYLGMLPGNSTITKKYYGHDGTYFAETAPFWGGMPFAGPRVKENWTLHYFTPILELSMMMLDYYDYTGDKKFVQETLIPIASAGVEFFDQHFPRDDQGKLLLDPDNSIEMFWKVHDPAPDIAALHAVLPRLIALPDDLVDPATRAAWVKLSQELPDLPLGKDKENKTLLLPYTGSQAAKSRNAENPELYAIYPYRLYGLDKPDYKLALDTFNARKRTDEGCWNQSGIQAAMLGLADVAKENVVFNFTQTDQRQKFQVFWTSSHDYTPDEDNGGNGENILQNMLLQFDGKKIMLLPAWPKGWDADFKLNAPFQTTVQGSVVGGKLTNLVVTPSKRMADVVDMSTEPPPSMDESDRVKNAPPITNTPLVDLSQGPPTLLSPQDAIVAIKSTVKGQPNTLATRGDFGGGDGNDELVSNAIDGNTDTKYFNKAQNGSSPPGVGTGFVVTPKQGKAIVTGIQFATAGDAPERDPLAITLEGSNDADAQTTGAGFVLIYEGPIGLDKDPDRSQWGTVITFPNTTAYKSYRVLITQTRSNTTGATQYSEVKLIGIPTS